ncbi:cell division protein FtsB [Gayadomonas joobiniege]|uniref:cell division protein FtsB n=1 Tax=Gayadomonas joobiniege TaxID=1234606 RepID=UPI00037E66FB|nr:cell division protein FtsB [Gayadomonas joobiniege]
MKLFKLCLLCVFLLLQHRLWLGDNAYQENKALNTEIKQLVESNQELNLRNQVMLAEIKDLKSGLAAIEERARNELGLIKNNETFYRIVPDPQKALKQNE